MRTNWHNQVDYEGPLRRPSEMLRRESVFRNIKKVTRKGSLWRPQLWALEPVSPVSCREVHVQRCPFSKWEPRRALT